MKKFWCKELVGILSVIAVTVVTFAVALPFLDDNGGEAPVKQSTVLEMWNVESFEGGSGSRESFINRQAMTFEKKHPGSYVHVTTLSPFQAEEKLQNGEKFDIVAFSYGTGSIVADKLKYFDGKVEDFLPEFLNAGKVGNKVVALPLYCGLYCVFAREESKVDLSQCVNGGVDVTVFAGQCLFGDVAQALPQCNVTFSSQYSAYERFLSDKSSVLLGSQRDLFRLSQRESLGKISPLCFKPVDSYTDLVEFVALSSTANGVATEFVEHLTSFAVQEKLTEVNMFSAVATPYTGERQMLCQTALKNVVVPNVFLQREANIFD